MTYDDIIREMGKFGPFQRRVYSLLSLPTIVCGVHSMIGVFLAAKPDFRCLLPQESLENATFHSPPNITNATHPWDHGIKNWSQCERYDPVFIDPHNNSRENFYSTTPATVKCDSFVYDKTTYELTTTSEFNVVCDDAWLGATTDSLFVVGMMLGSLILGGLSDKYGRRPILCLALMIQLISGLLVAVSPEIISYMILRMIVGSTMQGLFTIIYVTAIEMVTTEERLMAGAVVELFYALGHFFTGGVAYLITNWRFLQIAITLPNLGFLIYWWFIPESARWLMSVGRLEETKNEIEAASSENGVKLSKDRLENMLSNCSVKESNVKKYSVLDLMRYPNLRLRSLLLFFNSFVNAMTFYGLAWNTSSLVGDDYINFTISSFMEIPAIGFLLLTADRWGRRNNLCATMLISGISLILRIFIPHDMAWLDVSLAMIGKLGISTSFAVLWIFSSEQFPTVIRNVGMGTFSAFGSMGAILSSYTNYSSVIWKHLPTLIYGSFNLIAGLLAILLPETMNEKLPETMEDGEEFGRRSKKLDTTSSSIE